MLLKIINLILILLLLGMTSTYSQNLTEEEKQEIIQSLDNWMYDSIISANHSSYAIQKVIENKIIEAVPNLIDNLWSQTPIDQFWSLYALSILGSSDTEALTLEYIDSLDHYYNNLEFTDLDSIKYYYYKNTFPFPISELKLKAIKILFELNNYSKSNFIFEVNEEEININANIDLLGEIIKHVPSYASLAGNELKRIAQDSELENFRFFAGSILAEIENYNEFVFDWLRNKYINEYSRSVVISVLTDSNKTAEVNAFIKEQLLADTSRAVKLSILNALIKNYGSPIDFKFLIDNRDIENDPFIKDMYKYYYNSRVRKPDSTISTLTMLDTLISYTNQCYGYEWLKDEAYKNELLNKLTEAKNKLNTGDSTGSYPKYVSEEGYKFLYYYAGYILDRLPEPPTVEGLPVNLKDSQGNLLQGSSQREKQ